MSVRSSNSPSNKKHRLTPDDMKSMSSEELTQQAASMNEEIVKLRKQIKDTIG